MIFPSNENPYCIMMVLTQVEKRFGNRILSGQWGGLTCTQGA
jgi:hypothetical protein